jgi:hypothetical protein
MCNVISQCEFESNVDDEYMYPMAIEKEFAVAKLEVKVAVIISGIFSFIY